MNKETIQIIAKWNQCNPPFAPVFISDCCKKQVKKKTMLHDGGSCDCNFLERCHMPPPPHENILGKKESPPRAIRAIIAETNYKVHTGL